MRTHLVSYSSPEFYRSHARLENSARRFGVQELHSWDRERLQETPFYTAHRRILDQRRGGGYWLWKPYMVQHTLAQLGRGDILFYADAGIEITGDLSPLVELCLARDGVLLFASHYDDVGNPGPNLCRHWVKRDCFVAMDCDQAAYHEARLLDASFLVLGKTDTAERLVRDWLSNCCRAELITDSLNELGLPNLPGFVEHRHDQSILSLLAVRGGFELFRHPGQVGNHAKLAEFLVVGEVLHRQWGSQGIFANSAYHTLLNHHREGARMPLFPELRDTVLAARSQRAARAQGARSLEPEAMDWALYFGAQLPQGIRLLKIDGTALDETEWRRRASGKPNLLFVDARRTPETLWREFELIEQYHVLDDAAFVLCWDGLSGATVPVYWRIWKRLQARLGLSAGHFHLGRANPRLPPDEYTGLIFSPGLL